MDPITIIVWLVIAACAIWLLSYACDRFKMPEPVRWICGLVVIILLLRGLWLHNLTPIHF